MTLHNLVQVQLICWTTLHFFAVALCVGNPTSSRCAHDGLNMAVVANMVQALKLVRCLEIRHHGKQTRGFPPFFLLSQALLLITGERAVSELKSEESPADTQSGLSFKC